MADYIRDEEEQAERLKEWWQKNGTATIVVIVLASWLWYSTEKLDP